VSPTLIGEGQTVGARGRSSRCRQATASWPLVVNPSDGHDGLGDIDEEGRRIIEL